jgi:hypothetical protein
MLEESSYNGSINTAITTTFLLMFYPLYVTTTQGSAKPRRKKLDRFDFSKRRLNRSQ